MQGSGAGAEDPDQAPSTKEDPDPDRSWYLLTRRIRIGAEPRLLKKVIIILVKLGTPFFFLGALLMPFIKLISSNK